MQGTIKRARDMHAVIPKVDDILSVRSMRGCVIGRYTSVSRRGCVCFCTTPHHQPRLAPTCCETRKLRKLMRLHVPERAGRTRRPCIMQDGHVESAFCRWTCGPRVSNYLSAPLPSNQLVNLCPLVSLPPNLSPVVIAKVLYSYRMVRNYTPKARANGTTSASRLRTAATRRSALPKRNVSLCSTLLSRVPTMFQSFEAFLSPKKENEVRVQNRVARKRVARKKVVPRKVVPDMMDAIHACMETLDKCTAERREQNKHIQGLLQISQALVTAFQPEGRPSFPSETGDRGIGSQESPVKIEDDDEGSEMAPRKRRATPKVVIPRSSPSHREQFLDLDVKEHEAQVPTPDRRSAPPNDLRPAFGPVQTPTRLEAFTPALKASLTSGINHGSTPELTPDLSSSPNAHSSPTWKGKPVQEAKRNRRSPRDEEIQRHIFTSIKNGVGMASPDASLRGP
ncbi:hypothetical protein P171DRAFT_93573 [Karstenula rhodostoma CBS 690.94]|uniref:Uncharacterized protein n=1 Tax=Karstenula rhodostoma CBS 690.94 TaxID=1392251 RepID=A0A9P4PDN5_9PLEO|nr:hypothetical protein P171DRAFT_93573 [Karstenula rhodostoma CBS 690.94]